MRITQVVPYPADGLSGVTRMVDYLEAALVSLGHNVTRIQPVTRDQARRPGWWWGRLGQRGGEDIVHLHTPLWPSALATLIGPTRPRVTTLHGPYPRPTSLRRRLQLRWSTARTLHHSLCVGVSRETKDTYGLGTRVIPNGVPIPEVGTDPDPRQVLYLGRLTADKGVPELLQAVAGLDLDLTLAGPAGIGFSPAQLPDNAHWIGPVTDPKVLLAKSGLLILPSHREGLPMVVAEALAHGVPVLATRVGDIPSFVREGEEGWLLADATTPSIRRGLEAYLARTPADLAHSRQAAQDTARQRLSVARMTTAYLELYDQAIGTRP